MTLFSNSRVIHVSTPPSSLWPVGKAINNLPLREAETPDIWEYLGFCFVGRRDTLSGEKEVRTNG